MKRYRLTVTVQGAEDLHFYGPETGPLLHVAKAQLLDTTRWKTLGALPLQATLFEREVVGTPFTHWQRIRVIKPKDAVRL